MANSFTLDDIRAAAEKKYGSTDITLDNGDVMVMLNPMRLSKENRQKLMSIQDELEAEDARDQEEILADAIRLVAKNGGIAEQFLREADGDLAILAQVFDFYTGGTQAGEASPSQD